MKLVTLSIIAATGAILFGSATVAEAGPRFSIQYNGSGYGGGYNGYYNQSPKHYPGYISDGGYGHGYGHGCEPQPYKVSTVEVNRYSQCKTAYDHCGRPYTYHVTVVTYCDHYSNGSSRTWSRTFN